MKKVKLLFLLSLFSLFTNVNFAQWTSVGQPDFTNLGVIDVTMDIKQNGNSVVVYKNTNNDSIYALEFTNNQWVQLSNSAVNSTFGFQSELALDNNDVPYVLYSNAGDSLIIRKWNGSSWENFGASTGFVGRGSNAKLKFSPNNEPVVAFSNRTIWPFPASVVRWDGNSWGNVLSPSVSNFQAGDIDFEFTTDNQIYIAITNLNGGALSVYKTDVSSWVQVGPSSNIFGGSTFYVELELNSSNIPSVLCAEGSLNNAASMKTWDGNNWVYVGNQGFSIDAIGYSDFKIVNQIPTVIFQNGTSRVMQYQNGSWTTLGSTLGLGNSHALAIRSDNTIFAAYNNLFNGYKLNVKKFCTSETSQATNAICQGQSYSFGSQTLNTAGSYSEVFINSDGCDSLVNLSLTISPTYSLNQSITLCAGESLQIGNSTYTQSGNYQSILTSQAGCDSTIYTQLTILNPQVTSVQQTICQGQSYNFGSQTINTAGSYSEVFINSDGCDSLVNLSLTISPIYSLNQSITLCAGESLQIGNSNYSQSGNYQTILTSQAGCDSTINTQLTVLSPLVTSEQQTICEGNYLVYNGDTLTIEADYDYVFQAQNGCDSTHTIQLMIENALNPIITETDGILSTSALGDNFQWIDCNNNLPINGAITNQFTPINDGNYAVEVTNNQCAWISDCYIFSAVSLAQINEDGAYFVYPNPAVNAISLTIPNGKSITSIVIVDELGRMVKKFTKDEIISSLIISDLENGFYYIHIEEKDIETTLEFIIRR